jgi:hypothetical protein
VPGIAPERSVPGGLRFTRTLYSLTVFNLTRMQRTLFALVLPLLGFYLGLMPPT